MAPIFDMLNHGHKINAKFGYCPVKNGFELKACSDIPKDEEIIISYGLKQ
jgi:hypothetical protein